MRPLSRLAVAIVALVALLVVVVGIPIALIVLVGDPRPNPVPSGADLGDMAAGRAPIPADLLISLLAGIMWLIWAQVAWATVLEALAAFRGRLARRALVLPGIQLGIGKLVTATTLLATSFSVKPVAAGPLMPVTVATQPEDQLPQPDPSTEEAGEVPVTTEAPKLRPYLTATGDTWWGIAEDTFGVGTRWKEIRNLNLGRTMDDGSVISASTDLLRPHWRLLLPPGSGAVATTAAASVDRGSVDRGSMAAVEGSDGRDVVVERGDTIWDLAEEDLRVDGAEPSVDEVIERVAEIAGINRAELNGEPDLIYPGQRLELPPLPELSKPRPPTQDVSPDEPTEPPPAADPSPLSPAGPEMPSPPEPPTVTTAVSTPTVTTAVSTTAVSTTAVSTSASTAEVENEVEGGVPVSTADVASLAGVEATSPGMAVSSTEPLADAPADTSVDSSVDVTAEAAELLETSGATPTGESSSEPEAPNEETGPEAAPVTDTPSPTGEVRPGDEDVMAQVSRALSLGEEQDLATAGSLSADGVAADESPGRTDPDTADSRAPIFVGLAALTLVGGYLHRARGRRRKTALQSRHAGRRPQPPKRRTRPVARRLAASAEPGHPEFVNVGLRALGRLLQDVPRNELPKISGVWVSQNRLVLALAEDSPRRCPPAPFTEFADGSGWSLHRSRFDEVRKVARGANGPLPLLTTVGTTTALDLALTTNSRAPAEAYGLESSLLFAVDLEAGRVISVRSPNESTTVEALTMMALELATSETADQADIICVGFGHRLATFDRVRVVDDLGSVMGELEDVTGRAVHAAVDASPFATRVGNGAADTWDPVIVFHADRSDPRVEELVELAELTDGGVTAVCGYETRSGWSFLIDGDRVSCPDLPSSLARHEFIRPKLEGVELVAELFDEPWGEIDLDERFWDPMDPVDPDPEWDAFDAGAGSWRPMQNLSEHDRAAMPAGPPPGVRTTDEVPPSDEHAMPPLKPLRHSVEHSTVPGAEIPPGYKPPEPTLPEPTLPETTLPESTRPESTRPEPTDMDPTDSMTDEWRPPGRHLYVVGGAPDAENSDTDAPGPGVSRADNPAPIAAADSGPLPDAELGSDIRISVLGNLTIEGHHTGDRRKPWKYTKTPELILYLLLHPGGASQDLLMEQLFPEQPPNRPRLNQLVSDARTKALGLNGAGEYHLPHASPTEPFYKLLPTVGFDLRDFAQHCANARRAESATDQAREWEAALKLVRGRPFTLPHDGYEWALPEIEATVVKVEEAAVALADLAVELGDFQLAVWATKQGLLTGTGYYELLVRRGRAALMLQDPEEIVRAFADLQMSLDYTGAPEEGMPDLSYHPELEDVYNDLSSEGRVRERERDRDRTT